MRISKKDLLERGITERIEPSFTMLMPLLEAAIDENRAELKKLWRHLLANAYDPKRQGRVRASFIEIAKRLDPYDALILQTMGQVPVGQIKPNARDFVVLSGRCDVSKRSTRFATLGGAPVAGGAIDLPMGQFPSSSSLYRRLA